LQNLQILFETAKQFSFIWIIFFSEKTLVKCFRTYVCTSTGQSRFSRDSFHCNFFAFLDCFFIKLTFSVRNQFINLTYKWYNIFRALHGAPMGPHWKTEIPWGPIGEIANISFQNKFSATRCISSESFSISALIPMMNIVILKLVLHLCEVF
jgi:hypothetical protein